MKTLKIITAFAILITVLNCSKITDKFTEKVEEKVNEEVKKTTEEVNKQMSQADSLFKVADEELNKNQKVKEALEDEKILRNPNGQWAIDAEASSSYGSAVGKNQSWSAEQMTGEPNVEKYGDNGKAWASKDPDKGIEWVELTFPKSVYATGLKIRQNYNPGAIIKIAFYDEKGNREIVWDDIDKTKYQLNTIHWFNASFEKTSYKTKKVRITLATNSVKGWNEIDAVQLIGE